MRGSNRFLSINGKTVKTPVVLASMAENNNVEKVPVRSNPAVVAFTGWVFLYDATHEDAARMCEVRRHEDSAGAVVN